MGVLNKYLQPVPLKENYSKRAKSDLWLIIGVAAAIGICFALASCNAYNKIGKNPPKTTKDSANLTDRFGKTYPPKPPKLVQGKTVTKTVTKIDDRKVKQLQSRIDSLIDELNFTNDLIGGLPDLDSLKRAIKREVLKDCKTQTDTIYSERVDTSFQD